MNARADVRYGLPPEASLGVRPFRPNGYSMDMEALTFAQAVQTSAHYRFRWVIKRTDRVVLEFLERDDDETEARWQTRCGCGYAEEVPLSVRPTGLCGWRCGGGPTLPIVTRIPAKWRWSGDSDWTRDRADRTGATAKDPERFWERFPISCLFAKAIREGVKLHAAAALPLGVQVYYPEEERAAQPQAGGGGGTEPDELAPFRFTALPPDAPAGSTLNDEGRVVLPNGIPLAPGQSKPDRYLPPHIRWGPPRGLTRKDEDDFARATGADPEKERAELRASVEARLRAGAPHVDAEPELPPTAVEDLDQDDAEPSGPLVQPTGQQVAMAGAIAARAGKTNAPSFGKGE